MNHRAVLLASLTTLVASSLPQIVAQGPTWANPHSVPPARHEHAMAFDDGRGRAVLFGGIDLAGNRFGDTWEWDGLAWIARAPLHSPSARHRCGMAYDPVRGVTVLFGGNSAAGDEGDTWEWDGDDWTQRSPASSPQPRNGHAMAYHGGTNPGILVHGGSAGGSTWQWDGTTWTLRTTSGPSANNTGMAYASSQQRTYLMNNLLGSPSVSVSAWEWNGTTWTLGSGGGAPTETGVTYDPDRDQLFAVGGLAFHPLFNFYLNSVGAHGGLLLPNGVVFWSTTTTPFVPGFASFTGSASVYDTARRCVLTFGGRMDAGPFGGLTLSSDLMQTLSSTGVSSRLHPQFSSPGSRTLGDMAFDAASGKALLFGGWDGTQVLGDAWTFDGRTWTNHGPAGVPARMQPALCYLPSFGATVLFGGGDFGTTFYNDTMVWSGSGFLPTLGTGSPPARRDHDMVCDTARNRIVMYGGYDGSFLSDTWELRQGPLGLQWNQIAPIGSPGPRNGHRMAYDQRRQKVVLFGGSNQGIFDGTTWEYTPGNFAVAATWTQMAPVQSPPARWLHTMDYDPARGVIVLTGGYGNPTCGNLCASYLNDVWEYDGITWTQRSPANPPIGREGAASCYDTLRQRVIVQGGNRSVALADTWFYNAPVDRFAQGMASGSTLELRCLKFPVAGRPVRLSFGNPSGLGWITVFAGPAPGPGLTLGPGLLCSTGTLYGFPSILVDAMGNPGAIEFPLPASMAGQGFVAQGISFDLAACLNLTDPLVLTVHAP